MDGNVSEVTDAGGSPGKSSLFFLTNFDPGSDLFGDRVGCLGKYLDFRGIRSAFDGP